MAQGIAATLDFCTLSLEDAGSRRLRYTALGVKKPSTLDAVALALIVRSRWTNGLSERAAERFGLVRFVEPGGRHVAPMPRCLRGRRHTIIKGHV